MNGLLAALRFIRACIGTKDEIVYRHFINKEDIFGHIVRALLTTKGKDNLINSACLEFFEFIRKVNIFNLLITTFNALANLTEILIYIIN